MNLIPMLLLLTETMYDKLETAPEWLYGEGGGLGLSVGLITPKNLLFIAILDHYFYERDQLGKSW